MWFILYLLTCSRKITIEYTLLIQVLQILNVIHSSLAYCYIINIATYYDTPHVDLSKNNTFEVLKTIIAAINIMDWCLIMKEEAT